MEKKLLPIILTILIQGCSTMNQKQCAGADWNSLGKNDAIEGKNPDYYGKREKACQKYGITPSKEDYTKGRAEGFRNLCKPEKALELGLNNKGKQMILECPEEMRTGFENGYNNGYEIYINQGALEKTRNGIKRLNDRLKEKGLQKEKIKEITSGLDFLKSLEKNQLAKIYYLMKENGVDPRSYYSF
jgi:hypothetical protein